MRPIDADNMIRDLDKAAEPYMKMPDYETDRAYIMIQALKLWIQSVETMDNVMIIMDDQEVPFVFPDDSAQDIGILPDYAKERYQSGAWSEDVIIRLFDENWITVAMYRQITGNIPNLWTFELD